LGGWGGLGGVVGWGRRPPPPPHPPTPQSPIPNPHLKTFKLNTKKIIKDNFYINIFFNL